MTEARYAVRSQTEAYRAQPEPMGQETLDGTDIDRLRQRYRQTVMEELPQAATSGDGWPIHQDHCFARVVLDNVFEDEWYEHVEGRPAYDNLSATELRTAITIADRLLEEGPSLAIELNRRSLRWRGEIE